MKPAQPQTPFAVLNDPDTGVRLPGEENQAEGRKHISIETIVMQLQEGAQCVITFDQSDYRNSELSRQEQHQAKMRRLAEKGCHSFYYDTHAPFLFAVRDSCARQQLHDILISAGIPEERIKALQSATGVSG